MTEIDVPAAAGLAMLLDPCASEHERVRLTKHGRPIAALVSIDGLSGSEPSDV